MRKLIFLVWVLLLPTSVSMAQSVVPLEAFAQKQKISLVRISPNGEMIAFLRMQDGKPLVLVKRIDGPMISGANLEGVKPSNIRWASNEYLLLTVSNTGYDIRFRAKHQRSEYYRTFSFHIKSKKIVQLLKYSSAKLSTYSINLGSIIAIDHETPAAYIPAANKDHELDVYKVDMKKGRGIVARKGVRSLRKWVMNSANQPVVRVYHFQENGDFQIQVPDKKWWKTIYKKESELPPFNVIGLNMDETALIVNTTTDAIPFEALYEMDLETGEWGKPLFQAEGYDLGGSILDPYTNLVVGVSWVADQDEYHWFDPELAALYKALKGALTGSAVRLTSWSKDRKKFILSIAKPGRQVKYGVYFVGTKELKIIASARPILDTVVLGKVT
ncbi:hypothetical protein MNBD_ALPHA06-1946, partial [hydrothermal vent metagenome]